MNKLFNGEVARITGGSSGIGRATAILFAAEGARVVVASRRAEESQETVRLIQAAGGDAMFVKTDVSKAAEAEAMVAATVQRYGALHFAFNNAGIEGTPFVPLVSYAESTWDDVIGIILKGVRIDSFSVSSLPFAKMISARRQSRRWGSGARAGTSKCP